MNWLNRMFGIKEKDDVELLTPLDEEKEQAKVEEKVIQEEQKECILCLLPINPKETPGKINGKYVHRKCFRKSKKMIMQGIPQDEMILRLRKEVNNGL
jgi:hypothetical protein